MTDEQRDLEERASRIIWEAAGLRPGIPGHAGKTAVLVGRMRQLLREAQGMTYPAPVPQVPPTGRIGKPEPPALQQLHPPGVDQAMLQQLREKYAPPGRAS
jgi:hypothetical protein